MKKTAMLFANGFEEVEALTVVDLLRRAEIVCDIVALDGAATVTGSHGIAVGADKAFEEV
ncbi:MAG: DJ-1/PfpI family protein, partial [Oscillospiraceae bacterium]|nr:DJ-1/PfpI family protein [Oscillospiraceae bacterium]